MNDYAQPPEFQPLPAEAFERQADKQREDYAEREKRLRRESLAKKHAMAQRYDPNVMVVIEYISPEREKEPRPIIWDIEGAKYGFWRNERKGKGLGPWQERVPASAGLPRTDNIPRLWRLIHDPRDTYVVQPEDVAPAPPTEAETEVPATAPPVTVPPESDVPVTDADGITADMEEEYAALCDEVLTKRGPKAGQFKKSATPEQIERWEELRAIFQPE